MKHPLDASWLYLAWQKPFVRQKLAPLIRRHPRLLFERVLDVGCGPGVNAGTFVHTEYLGVDLEPRYVATARARHGERFIEGDAADLRIPGGQQFDCMLINSLLHHLDDRQVCSLLRSARDLLLPSGSLYIMDLIVPGERGLPRMLALADRGRYPRPLPALRALLASECHINVEEQFPLHIGALKLWHMVYFEAATARPCA